MQLDIQIRHPCAEAHTNILIRADDTSWRAQKGVLKMAPNLHISTVPSNEAFYAEAQISTWNSRQG